MNDLINAFFSRDKQLGILSEYDLRYLVTYTGGTKSIDILLDNAMKYSEDATPIKIILRRHRTHCILSVSGKGEPISKSDLNNIFKRFYRIDKARSDRQSYGLGLSIADSIIGEHNGRIWAESESGHNTFYVSLTVSEKNTAARRNVGQ